jgi:hypothetical protein
VGKRAPLKATLIPGSECYSAKNESFSGIEINHPIYAALFSNLLVGILQKTFSSSFSMMNRPPIRLEMEPLASLF